MKLAVLGSGSWGVALSILAHRAHESEVWLWGRDATKVEAMAQTRQSPFFPGLDLPAFRFTSDLSAALANADIVVCALPCASLPTVTLEIVPLLPTTEALVVCGSKGLHPESGLRPSQIWAEAGLPVARFVALSGPNLAREIVVGAATSSVVASVDAAHAKKAQVAFDSSSFRVYTNADVLGVELGGALKNVVAIAAGLGDGKGFGDNAKAALMTRHWREMARLAVALGASESTLWGLSGLGDLLATCSSAQSRNHRLGTLLGQGKTLEEAQREIAQTVEGIHTCRAALELGERHGVFLPVTRGLGAILFQGLPVEVALAHLLNRPGRSESEDETPKMSG
ncbi:glycerol-3-phosphate dehydrogenase [NAD(P)+] [Abditibacteriota bacterium]|nr:glycerol-3-phosphate dehydrogenase [NAD(P)+] [Abditibacteriota bacterium]